VARFDEVVAQGDSFQSRSAGVLWSPFQELLRRASQGAEPALCYALVPEHGQGGSVGDRQEQIDAMKGSEWMLLEE
jgi:hypothetical protein